MAKGNVTVEFRAGQGFSRDREVFQSSDAKPTQLPKAQTSHEQEFLTRTTGAAGWQIGQFADELYGLTKQGTRAVGRALT